MEDKLTMGNSFFANVRPADCTGPPKRPAQTIGHVGPSNFLCFTSDQQEIGSYKRSIEVAEEVVSCMKGSIFGNVRLAASNGPPKRPTKIASFASVSMGAPSVATLLQDVTNPKATILEGEGTSKEDKTGSPTNIGELAARRQQSMDWQEKSRFPLGSNGKQTLQVRTSLWFTSQGIQLQRKRLATGQGRKGGSPSLTGKPIASLNRLQRGNGSY